MIKTSSGQRTELAELKGGRELALGSQRSKEPKSHSLQSVGAPPGC